MPQIHLPYGLTKGDIYLTMKAELIEQGLSVVVSLSRFYNIWRYESNILGNVYIVLYFTITAYPIQQV